MEGSGVGYNMLILWMGQLKMEGGAILSWGEMFDWIEHGVLWSK